MKIFLNRERLRNKLEVKILLFLGIVSFCRSSSRQMTGKKKKV